ncbi:hypothetical protein EDD90_4090 [Streptomyces sp. Ag109_O5-1]|uniref:hypothetical protein n=1 Tax=Streptomyces sp. Ag109_O5-1 TaxID=1938851 RepID=UPI000F505504|nr:hypothetical protein [Streptomyces sp. Ag109_O5-1]RPE41016.1 hypothetical protein EDD90_4090 [Streptomyces sp. Ag109_O5-1]
MLTNLIARTPARLGRILLAVAVLLLAWTVYLGSVMGGEVPAQNWSVSWTGLDLLEVATLTATGLLAIRRSRAASPVAAAAAALLLLDAWFDVMTVDGPIDWYIACAMALGVELPACYVMIRLSKTALDWPGRPPGD